MLTEDMSTEVPETTATLQQVAMTLASIAYSDRLYLQRQLAYRSYATAGQWALRWLGVSAGNQMYVAQNTMTAQWVVAIRGSVTDPLTEAFWIDWFRQDLGVFLMEPPPVSAPSSARIASGTSEGFRELVAMRDGGQNLVDFLRSRVQLAPQSILVVGHSLGGTLASVLAPYLYETLCRPQNKPASCILPVTFAAPTAGNQAYASYVESLFSGFPLRCVNNLDLVPQTWSLNGLNSIMQSYNPSPKIPDYIYLLVRGVRGTLEWLNNNYSQPGRGTVVTSTLRQNSSWIQEAGRNHSGQTYLSLYGAPPVIFPYPPQTQVTGAIPRSELPSIDEATVPSH